MSDTTNKTLIDVTGTILEETAAILAAQDFDPSPTEPVAEGEKPIGTLSDLEKALLTARNRWGDRSNTTTKQTLADANNPEEAQEARAAASARCAVHEALDNMMWANIRMRIGKPSYQGTALGIRDGYQIVLFQSMEETHEIGAMFQAMFGGE